MASGVFDSIVSGTRTPRAEDKVLQWAGSVAPTEPVDNDILWEDDEPPAVSAMKVLPADYQRNKSTRDQDEVNADLDELGGSEVSYPHDDEKNPNGGQKQNGMRKSARNSWDQEPTQIRSPLEDFGSQGWNNSPTPARAPSRQSRQTGHTPRASPAIIRPPSTRPGATARAGSVTPSDFLHDKGVAISIREPSIAGPAHSEVHSLASTDPDLREAMVEPERATSPQSLRSQRDLLPSRKTHNFFNEHPVLNNNSGHGGKSPHGAYKTFGSGLRSRVGSPLAQQRDVEGTLLHFGSPQTAPIQVPQTPQTPSVQALPSPAFKPALISDPPPAPMSKRDLSRAASPALAHTPRTAFDPSAQHTVPPIVAKSIAPFLERTQYGPQKSPELMTTFRLKKVADPEAEPEQPEDIDIRSPRSTTRGTPKVNALYDLGSADEHIGNHRHEVTEVEEHVIVHPDTEEEHVRRIVDESVLLRAASVTQSDSDENVANHMQEVYEVVDAGEEEPFTLIPDERIPSVHGSEEDHPTPKAAGLALLPTDIEIYPPSEAGPPREGSEMFMVDEYPDTLDTMPERELIELLKTPRSGHSGWTDGTSRMGDRAIENLHHFHDEDLCILLQAVDDELQHPVVRKAVRRAISSRLRTLGMGDDYDVVKKNPQLNAELHEYAFGSSQEHDLPDDAPHWAKRLDAHVLQLTEQMKALQDHNPSRDKGKQKLKYHAEDAVTVDRTEEDNPGFDRDSLHPGHAIDEGGIHYNPSGTDVDLGQEGTYGDLVRKVPIQDSPGGQIYDAGIFKLHKREMTPSPASQAVWEIEEEPAHIPGKGNSEMDQFSNDDKRVGRTSLDSNALTPRAGDSAVEPPDWLTRFGLDPNEPPPWLKVYQRLLNWAIVWPVSELNGALRSTERGEQVDEVALSIWTTQAYKRYVRTQLTQYPPRTVDKMFVPPNLADAINNAVYNGRHADAADMLRDMWLPFGLNGAPRVILVLARHRREENHWVAHRFSLAEGQIVTYDCYTDRALPDSRPLGWWFAIRIAFPNERYPPPDGIAQRILKINRPLQLLIDNSVGAAGIWRNLLMGAKPERLIELDRLRDLIRQEVKTLIQRKEMGKLSITKSRE